MDKPISFLKYFKDNNIGISYKNKESIFSTSMEIGTNMKELQIAFNPLYISDALTSIGKDADVKLLIPDNRIKPMLMTNSDATEKYLVLPIRMNK